MISRDFLLKVLHAKEKTHIERIRVADAPRVTSS